jgi:hypothetical protein
MSKYLGDFALGQTVRDMFDTSAGNGGRADFNNALETADIRVYKDNGATERASQAGFAVASGFDSMVGITAWSIDTSDNTTAGFYTAGSDYAVVLYPDETVDGQSVAAVLATFSIENRLPNLEVLPALSVGAHPLLGILDSGTAQAATATTVQLRSALTFADDIPNGCIIGVRGSTQGYWQFRVITDYVGSTDTATVDTWNVTPTGTITYVVYAGAPVSPTQKFPATIAAGDMAPNSLTASALATDAVAEIQSGLATSAALATVAGYLDTEVAAILAAVDTEVAAIKARTDLLTLAAIGQEVLLTLAMARGNRVVIDGSELVTYDTNGTTELSRQPIARLASPANPLASVG